MEHTNLPGMMTMAILTHFECAICFELMKDAMVTSCGHSFCAACTAANCAPGSSCPTCRNNITLTVANYFIRELIADVSDAVVTSASTSNPSPAPAVPVSLCGLELLDSMGFHPDLGPAALREVWLLLSSVLCL